MQLKTMDGRLTVVEHAKYLKYPATEPVINPYSDLIIYFKEDIEQLEEIDDDIFKVRIQGLVYCVKTVYCCANNDSFLTELRKLREIPQHPNMANLVGVTDAGEEEGKIDGIVLPYFPDSTTLENIDSVTDLQRNRLKEQIFNAIKFLHEHGVVWGDAKPENILIYRNNSDAVLIDFGGGYTPGWVDWGLRDTKEGDLQGLKRIIEYLDTLNTKDTGKVTEKD